MDRKKRNKVRKIIKKRTLPPPPEEGNTFIPLSTLNAMLGEAINNPKPLPKKPKKTD